ncbi:MAG: mannose-1-phosphate guanylyltransferase [Candidatus Marinimicrobia bacterium]|nr:mannose-1-phosphate guanylyltransferase [Candidatus Neomarinimicrobiota bacterium]
MTNNYYSVIMAGGVGKRFWPRSTKKSPKQLLNIFGEDTMINLTIKRLEKISLIEHIFIITNHSQAKMILAQNKKLKWKNFIIEPSGKNTAPAIALASAHIIKKDPSAIIGFFPADHLIKNENKFIASVKIAITTALKNTSLVTFGIKPTYPATGYGYIQIEQDNLPGLKTVHKTKTFAEKPNLHTAKRFVKSKEFVWNSGMFVWKGITILKAINEHVPELFSTISKIRETIGTKKYETSIVKLWSSITPVSIDYGILEKANNVEVVLCNFDWNDIGSWNAVYKIDEKDKNKNVNRSEGLLTESTKNYVYSKKSKIFTYNIHNLVIIEENGVILVLPRKDAEHVKDVVDTLQINDKENLL